MNRFASFVSLALSALFILISGGMAWAHEAVSAPPLLGFTPPAPGTYELQTIMPAPDGEVLDTAGRARPLSDYTRGKVTVLGLVYTRCSDAEGCPRAWAAFSELRRALKSHPSLAQQTRLVNLSFDPAHDTPVVMMNVAKAAAGRDKSVEWDFLTTASMRKLAPIVDGFGQDLRVSSELEEGASEPVFSHTLKVFLIDHEGRIREIYTTAFLIPQVIVNDIKTLLMERHRG
jgi:protein SCO1/2